MLYLARRWRGRHDLVPEKREHERCQTENYGDDCKPFQEEGRLLDLEGDNKVPRNLAIKGVMATRF